MTIQEVQTKHRRRLAETWSIPLGSRIFELGCGQGDMTAVLAEAVGHTGSVFAVDLADRSYGAPETLGEATDLIKASPLGDCIDFRFNFDILDPSNSFPDQSFDIAVMAHSSWYFSSPDQLRETFAKLRTCAKRLCFAEWNLEPETIKQLPHYLAITIQGQIEAYKDQSMANVRTPLSKKQTLDLMMDAGWAITEIHAVHSPDLQDAFWEVAACFQSFSEAKSLGLPPRVLASIESQLDVLSSIAMPSGEKPLPVYSVVAD